jgi:hypothetical protein
MKKLLTNAEIEAEKKYFEERQVVKELDVA